MTNDTLSSAQAQGWKPMVRIIVTAGYDRNGNVLRANLVYDRHAIMREVCKGYWPQSRYPDVLVIHQYGRMSAGDFRALIKGAKALAARTPEGYIFFEGI